MLLTLQSLQLTEPLDTSGESLVLVEMILPRPAIARRAALKPVRLRRGHRSLARQPFYESALLKEKVDGRFGIKVAVTRPLKQPELKQFLRQLLAKGVEELPDILGPAFTSLTALSPLLGDLAEEAADHLADRLGDDAPVFIASGGLDLDSESLQSGPLTIPLRLKTRLRRSDLPPGPQSREGRRRSTRTYRKGSPIGELQLGAEA